MTQIKIGDVFTIEVAKWKKRKWWQLWKPKWIELPKELKTFRVVENTDPRNDLPLLHIGPCPADITKIEPYEPS